MAHYTEHTVHVIILAKHHWCKIADINECQETPNVCEQQCLNMIGGYRCTCARGYRLRGRNICEGYYSSALLALKFSINYM